MTLLRGGFDLLIALIGVAAWSFAAFVFGSRFLSPTAGGLLAVALFISTLAMVVGGHLQDSRLQRLAAGVCPGCRQPLASEHRHRRWDADQAQWTTPATIWECSRCGFSHSESWACPACPAAV
jgi:hypothetical protein